MSLDLSVLMKERLTKERLACLHAFLIKEKFVKEQLGPSSFFYFSTKPYISIDVFLIKAPMKGNDFWDDLYENGERVDFPPKSAITMESRHTEASHLESYSLGKALAHRFGGIIFDHQMSTAYSARGKPICDPGGTSHVIVEDCRSLYNYQDGIKGWDLSKDQNGIIIRGCTVSYNGQDGIAAHLHDSDWVIEGNIVHHNCLLADFKDSAGIKILSQTVRNITAENNLVYSNGIEANSYRGKGIWVDTAGPGIVVRKNRIHDNSTNGFEIENSSNVVAAYNIIYNHSARYGIYVKAGKGFPAVGNKIYNNTIYQASIGINCEGTANAGSFVGNEFKNNISVGSSRQLKVGCGAENDGINGRGNIYTHNCFGREFSGFIGWPARVLRNDYDSWRVVYGNDTHSINAEPQFTDSASGDFTLRPNSPCIDAGTNVGLSEYLLGTQLSPESKVDIGAYERQ